jgi:6-phosphogluconolactonase
MAGGRVAACHLKGDPMSDHEPHVLVRSGRPAVAEAAARVWVDAAQLAVERHGAFHVALAGGSTPRAIHAAVTRQPDLDPLWQSTHVWWGDERAVPPEHADSNYRMADETLLSCVPVPSAQVHRMPAERDDLEAAARAYALALAQGVGGGAESAPALDLVWLGLGEDGHTASLFPHAKALAVRDRWVAAVTDAPKPPPRRLTLTLPVFAAARRVVFVACGADKAEALRDVLEGPDDPARWPAQAVTRAAAARLWLVDEAAACLLTRTPTR